jgi:hypothetical protein
MKSNTLNSLREELLERIIILKSSPRGGIRDVPTGKSHLCEIITVNPKIYHLTNLFFRVYHENHSL